MWKQTAALPHVTGNYYTVLGVSPLMGRLISPGDSQGNQISQVAVIGYELWQERFGGDPAVVGKNIRIDGKLFTIIGVTRKWFTGMIAGSPPEITIPAGAAQPDFQDLEIVGVAQSARILDIRDGNAPVIYTSALQLRDFARGGTLLLRGSSASAGINKAIVDEVRSYNHEYATGIDTFEEKNERSLSTSR
jgi:hypothetical protein